MKTATFIAASALALPLAFQNAHADLILAELIIDAEGGSIEGTADKPGHEGWIVCEAFGQGISRGEGLSGAARRSGAVSTGEFSLIKRLDKASPKIAEHLTLGTNLPRVTVDYFDNDSSSAPLRTVLQDVVVSSHRISMGSLDRVYANGLPGLPPTEEFSLQPAAIEWVYSIYNSGGQTETFHGSHGDPFDGTSDPLRDDDEDGVPNNLDDDDDNDQMPDEYERRYGMLPFHNDAHLDGDGDGRTNYAEFVGGSAPDDSFSVFGVRSIRHDLRKKVAEILFPIMPGRDYCVHMSLDGKNWIEIDQFSVAPDSEESEAAVEFHMLDANQFFKVEATMSR